MNRRVILNYVLASVILAALAGCIKVEIISPNDVGEPAVEVRVPAEPLPPATQSSMLTPKPYATLRPTNIPTGEPMITLVPVIALLYEKFDNPNSYYGYNPQILKCNECVGITKGANSIRFDFKSPGNPGAWSTITSYGGGESFNDIRFLQGDFRIIDVTDVEGEGHAGPFLSLATPLGEGMWFSMCGMGYHSYQFYFHCTIFNDSEEIREYVTDSINIEKGDWHTAKMEINPQTKEITFFLDNVIIGQHIPYDKESLTNREIGLIFGVASNSNQDRVVAEFDNILLAQYP